MAKIILKNIEYFKLLDDAYNSIPDEENKINEKVKNIIFKAAQELEKSKNLEVTAINLVHGFSKIFMQEYGKIHLTEDTKKLYKISNDIAQKYMGQAGIGIVAGPIFH